MGYKSLMSTPFKAALTLSVPLPDEAATLRLGGNLAAILRPGDLIALTGGLGSGKTTLARAMILARLAAFGRAEEVPSPSFTLVQTYETPDLLLTHVDLYRIEDEEELVELGLDDAVDEGVLIIEWPDKAPDALTRLHAMRLDIELTIVGEGRREARLASTEAGWASRLQGWGKSE